MDNWTIMLRDKTITCFAISEGQKISIGRGKECDVTIDNTAISRQHIALSLQNGLYFVSDLGSKNGTYVNGKKITATQQVSEEDLVEFGKFHLAQTNDLEEELELPSSVSANLMDMDDETIFISSKKSPKPPASTPPKPNQKGPFLKLVQGNATPSEFSLHGKNSVKIGKDPSCDIVIRGWFIAKSQCYIIKRDKGFCVVPQNSWVGTFVNDNKVKDELQLYKGDIIKIKGTSLRFD